MRNLIFNHKINKKSIKKNHYIDLTINKISLHNLQQKNLIINKKLISVLNLMLFRPFINIKIIKVKAIFLKVLQIKCL